MVELTDPKESASRKQIDATLVNLGWKIDEFSPDCNVFTERPKTKEQASLLGRRPPDYILYRSQSDDPLAIIEAKRPGKTLGAALDQAVEYAELLNVPVVFACDGSLTEARFVSSKAVLRLDGDLIADLISERLLLRFINEGPAIQSPIEASLSKQQLIDVFADANDLLRNEGLRKELRDFLNSQICYSSNLSVKWRMSENSVESREYSSHAIVGPTSAKGPPTICWITSMTQSCLGW